MTQKERVLQFIASMGVRYIERIGTTAQNRQQWEEWEEEGACEAPFMPGLGIIKDPACIISTVAVDWVHLIHEAGHLLCTETPLNPKDNEYEWLGWEYAVCLQLGLSRAAFIRGNAEYGINWLNPQGQMRDLFADLPKREIPLFLENRLAFAKQLGLVLPDGRVTCHPNRRLLFP